MKSKNDSPHHQVPHSISVAIKAPLLVNQGTLSRATYLSYVLFVSNGKLNVFCGLRPLAVNLESFLTLPFRPAFSLDLHYIVDLSHFLHLIFPC